MDNEPEVISAATPPPEPVNGEMNNDEVKTTPAGKSGDVAGTSVVELGPCCWLGLCCPPADAAAALGAHLEASIPMSNGDVPAPEETYTSIAGRILAEFRLVPKELAPTVAFQYGSMANAATHQLTKLNEHVRKELLDILLGLGYEVSHE